MTIRDVFRVCCCVFLGANIASVAQGQACSNALDLCGQTDTTAVLGSPLDLPGSAALAGEFDANRVQMIHFHTTFFGQFAEPSEPANVVLSALSCEAPLVARVFQSNPLDVCNAEEFVPASELWTVSSDTTLTTLSLFQNTDYVLLLGSSASGCAVDVRLEGLALSIDACCTSSIDYGESTTVEVLGSDPDLGFDWTPVELAQMVDNQLAELTPYETTTFEVTGYIQGCSYTDAVLVAVGSPIEVPNAFRPTTMHPTTRGTSTGCPSFPPRPLRYSTVGAKACSVPCPTPILGRARTAEWMSLQARITT